MSDKAIEILTLSREQVVERCKRELAEIDQAISRLQTAAGKPTTKSLPVKPGQYKGVSAADALAYYLNERGGGPVGIKQIVQDLQLGHCEPAWKRDRYERNLKIMISNTGGFEYDKATDSVRVANSKLRLA